MSNDPSSPAGALPAHARAHEGMSNFRSDTRAREGSLLTPTQMEICQRLMAGESVRRICRDEHMPAQSTVFEWLASDMQFRSAYQIAKQLLAETLADDILEISDDASGDFIEREEGPAFNAEHVQRSKLRVDSRKWLAAKLAPKRYGDSTALRMDSMGDQGRQLSAEDIAVRLAAIFSAIDK